MRPSVSKDKKGLRIDFTLPSGRNTCLRLKQFGITTRRDYEMVANRLGDLIAARTINATPPSEVSEWLKGLGEPLYRRLQQWGLVSARESDLTLHDLLDQFFGKVAFSTKESTRQVRNRAIKHAKRFFSADVMVSAITTEDGIDFRNWLLGLPGQQGRTMAEDTVRKTCSVVHQALRHAAKKQIISVSPFADPRIPKTAKGNRSRHKPVSREFAERMILAAPTLEWKLVIALGRFAGLRLPSEAKDLRWSDIDFTLRLMRVKSPKTAHHADKGSRLVPIFPELLDLLEAARSGAASPDDFVLPVLRDHTNWNVGVRNIILGAELEVYPKTLHALRASCETDWLRKFSQPDLVAAWLGHSVKIMYEHYIHLDAGASASEAALQAAKERGDARGEPPSNSSMSMVVTPSASTERQQSPESAQAPLDAGLAAFADECLALVAAGGFSPAAGEVDLIGLEPTTSSMPWMRSSN